MRRMFLLFTLVLWMAAPLAIAQDEHDEDRDRAHAAGAPTAASHPDEAIAGHDGGHGPEYELLTIDGMTALWTIIVFVILVLILRAAAWKPIQKVLSDRERFIADSLEQARRDRQEAEARLRDYEQKLAEAKKEATAIVKEGRRDAEVLKHQIEEDARKESAAMVERAKREINIATDTAIKELYDLSARLATDVASRIIGKELNPKDHERLIAESIEEFGKVERN